jgi:AcrR family transcriptional regulator
MTKNKPKEPRERILEAAVSLFAQRGYAAVGVREIAKQAEVNIAMISYYFESKVGILKAIMEDFFDRYSLIFADMKDLAGSPDDCIRLIIRRIVEFVRGETDLALVGYNELPLDVPEIAQLKAKKVTEIISQLGWLMAKFNLNPVKDGWRMGIIAPSLISMVVMNFRLRPVLQQVFQLELDDAYYERLVETLSTLFLDGVHGIAAKNQADSGKTDE